MATTLVTSTVVALSVPPGTSSCEPWTLTLPLSVTVPPPTATPLSRVSSRWRSPLLAPCVSPRAFPRSASRFSRLATRVPDTDPPFVRRLRGAGGVLLGKTTTPEFGWKAIGDSPLTGVTRNPWNPGMTTGGSSAGAGAAAAAGLGPLHQGS
ncbi:MAG: hypothetical protein HY729_11555, partial [Candidatus Rokubacteria bacterium]|nr:hypothetical protein [Candidatus Rokubacteria bacterium]